MCSLNFKRSSSGGSYCICVDTAKIILGSVLFHSFSMKLQGSLDTAQECLRGFKSFGLDH